MADTKLLQIATDPLQYDNPDVGWIEAGGKGLEDPHRRHFFQYVEQVHGPWTGKAVLDIGAGTGWLVKHVVENGAALATGFDPSIANINYGKDILKVPMAEATIDTYDSHGLTFDSAIAIYVLSHVADLEMAFSRISSWLEVGGRFITVVPDYDYAKSSRAAFELEIEPIEQDAYGAYVLRILRDHGTIVDIIRDLRSYVDAALPNGMELTKHVPMKPTHHLIDNYPRYAEKKDTTLTHLLEFTKVSEI